MNKWDGLIIACLFIVAFSLWTLPIQNDSRPFGEGDSAWHFSIGDYIASSDKPIWRLPFYIGQWYYGYNEFLGPNALEYPPSNHYNYALMQVAGGGERFLPVLIYRAIASFIGIFSVYFLISHLYGRAAALIASVSMVYSLRERMIYLWGQQPTLVAVAIAPVTFYAFYRYLDFYSKGEHRPIYAYMTALLLASQYLLHIQGFVFSAVVLSLFTVLMSLKCRKIPFPISAHVVGALLCLMVLAAPFLAIYLGAPQGGEPRDVSRLLSWEIDHSKVAGSYSPSFVEGDYPSFLIPFLFAGFLIVLVMAGLILVYGRRASSSAGNTGSSHASLEEQNAARAGSRSGKTAFSTILYRRNADLLMLAWLGGVYVLLHADVFMGVSVERAARMLISEPALFYSLMGIGAVSWLSFFSLVRLPQPLSSIKSVLLPAAGYAIALVLLFSVFFSSSGSAKAELEGAYQSIFRITPVQSELAGWMRSTLPENAYAYYLPESRDFKMGTWQYPKLRWLLASSQRYVSSYTGQFPSNPDAAASPVYFIFDYSDMAIIISAPPNPLQPAAQQSALALQQFESANFNTSQAIYNKDNIRVYEVETANFQ